MSLQGLVFVLLKSSLTAVGLEPADQQRGGDPPPLQRSRHPQQVIPPAQDPLPANSALEPRLEIPIGPAPVETIQLLVTQIADSRAELQAQQVEQGEDDLGVTRRICGVLQ